MRNEWVFNSGKWALCVSLQLLTHVIDLRNYYRSFNNLVDAVVYKNNEKENNADQLDEKWNNLHFLWRETLPLLLMVMREYFAVSSNSFNLSNLIYFVPLRNSSLKIPQEEIFSMISQLLLITYSTTPHIHNF